MDVGLPDPAVEAGAVAVVADLQQTAQMHFVAHLLAANAIRFLPQPVETRTVDLLEPGQDLVKRQRHGVPRITEVYGERVNDGQPVSSPSHSQS